MQGCHLPTSEDCKKKISICSFENGVIQVILLLGYSKTIDFTGFFKKCCIATRTISILSEPIPDEGWVRIYYFSAV